GIAVRDLARKLVKPYGFVERRGIADVDVVGNCRDSNPDAGVDIRVRHVGAKKVRVVAQHSQQLRQEWITCVAGSSEVMMLDAIQEFRQHSYPAFPFAANEKQL